MKTKTLKSSSVTLKMGTSAVHGELAVPEAAEGLVLFAHGSGSSRLSPRNRFVASILNRAGFGTFLIDLLTHEEETEDSISGEYRFNIPFLSGRLLAATGWIAKHAHLGNLALGYFGASTGAAAAIVAASEQPEKIKAVVSRGGRPDLAGKALSRLSVPTLLIVGEYDHEVLRLNREGLDLIPAKQKMIEIVPGATHLFEEPGCLEKVSELAGSWFRRYLRALV